MNRPPTKGIRHIALQVENLRRMREFYVDLLGYQVEWEPDEQNLYLTSGSDNLALHETEGRSAGGSLDHFGLIVPQPGDVDAWADYLKRNGVRLRQEPRTHRDGARSIYFPDPEGNIIQIIHHPPISGK